MTVRIRLQILYLRQPLRQNQLNFIAGLGMRLRRGFWGFFGAGLVGASLLMGPTSAQQTGGTSPRVVFDKYCITCHNEKLHTAGLALDKLDLNDSGANAEKLEKVIMGRERVLERLDDVLKGMGQRGNGAMRQ